MEKLKDIKAALAFEFEINEAQAEKLAERYFVNCLDLREFIAFYENTLLNEKIVGTNFEKLKLVCRLALNEFVMRFKDKTIFEEWLVRKYKGKLFFRVPKGVIKYTYMAYRGNEPFELEKINEYEKFIGFDKFGNLQANGEALEQSLEKDLILDYIFYHQKDIRTDLYMSEVKSVSYEPINHEQEYQKTKALEAKTSALNADKFKDKIALKLDETFTRA